MGSADLHGDKLQERLRARFGALLDASPDAILIADAGGRIIVSNEQARRLFRYTACEFASLQVEQLMPHRYRSVHVLHRGRFNAAMSRRPMGDENRNFWGLRSDGEEFPVDISLCPLHMDGATFMVAAIRDMTVRRRVEEDLRDLSAELERSRAGLQAVLNSLDEGVIVFSLAGELINANPAALRMHGYRSLDEARAKLGRYAGELEFRLPGGELLLADACPITRIARGETLANLEVEVWLLRNAQRGIYSYSGVPVHNRQGAPLLGVCMVRDITAQKEAEERIRQTGLRDPLTGLPNRALLDDYSGHIFARARRARSEAAVLYLDLDRFKPINDTLGHEAGDAMLQAVASRITESIRQDDLAFRLGGDEFLVILAGISDAAQVADVARHLAEAIARPLNHCGNALCVSASIGISVFPRDSQDIHTLVNQADLAMYQAKHAGRGGYRFFSPGLAGRVSAQSLLEEQVKTALERNQFMLYYQPLVDLATARVTSVEALLRWPNQGGPEVFLPVAESSGLIGRLGEWVVAEAGRQHAAWLRHGLPEIPVAVNVSAMQFRQPGLAQTFLQAIRSNRIDAGALQLEVTETALMDDIEASIEQLGRLRSLGIKVALDDFGTGLTSLGHLSRMPIDKIKVDRSFVFGIEHDAVSRNVTDAIIALGRTLHLDVVAEGLESSGALDFLQQHGCSQAQGYHVCAPVAADAFEDWYRRHEPGAGAMHH